MDASNDLFDRLFVAGSFDTERITSQIQLCSVGEYAGLKSNGFGFDKVRYNTNAAAVRCSIIIILLLI